MIPPRSSSLSTVAERTTRPGAPRSAARGADALPPPEDLRVLARLAASVAAGDGPGVERAARALAGRLPRRALEEAVLQTYLFAGFPAAINGLAALERAWPATSGVASEASEGHEADLAAWRARGEQLCARVYGPRYDRLRRRMRELSAALDEWMVVEGYGKTLSRPGLHEGARELCAVTALAASGAARQLEAHLEGARRLGVDAALVAEAAREAVAVHVPAERRATLEAIVAASVPWAADEARRT